jgi:hypothetical protein
MFYVSYLHSLRMGMPNFYAYSALGLSAQPRPQRSGHTLLDLQLYLKKLDAACEPTHFVLSS